MVELRLDKAKNLLSTEGEKVLNISDTYLDDYFQAKLKGEAPFLVGIRSINEIEFFYPILL